MKRQEYKYWFFILPVLIPFLLCVLVPAVMGVYYSFTDWNGISNQINWVGLKNYMAIFSGQTDFGRTFVFTLLFALVSVVVCNVIGFLLALLVTQKMRVSNLFRTVFFMPNLVGGLLLGFTWQFVFVNVFEAIGKNLGIEALTGWLSTTSTGFWGLVIVFAWQFSGYLMIVYVAALSNIPQSVMEAAYIDGAGTMARLRHITIPLVAPGFTVGLFLTLANAFKVFDINLALTGGGPYKSTESMALNIYTTAFSDNRLGLAQAKALLYLFVVAAITLTQLYFNKKREVEM